jgi:hypothetical protein
VTKSRPQGPVGRRGHPHHQECEELCATTHWQIVKVGWGDLCLEQWHRLRTVGGDDLLLVDVEPSPRPVRYEATVTGLASTARCRLDSSSAVLLNHRDPDRHTLGVCSAFRRSTPNIRADGSLTGSQSSRPARRR